MGKQQLPFIKFLIYTRASRELSDKESACQCRWCSFNPWTHTHNKSWTLSSFASFSHNNKTVILQKAESLSNLFQITLPIKGLIWVEPMCVWCWVLRLYMWLCIWEPCYKSLHSPCFSTVASQVQISCRYHSPGCHNQANGIVKHALCCA